LSNNLTLNTKTNIFTFDNQDYLYSANSGGHGPISTAVNPPSKDITIQELNSMTDLQRFTDETVDGVTCYHVKGISSDETLELWIGKGDYLIRKKIKQTGINDANHEPIYVTTVYSDFDAQTAITLPLDSNRKLLPDWDYLYPL